MPVRSSEQDFCDSWSLVSSKRSVGILGKWNAQHNTSSAELRDGSRPSVLALKPSWLMGTSLSSQGAKRLSTARQGSGEALVLRKEQRILVFIVLENI